MNWIKLSEKIPPLETWVLVWSEKETPHCNIAKRRATRFYDQSGYFVHVVYWCGITPPNEAQP